MHSPVYVMTHHCLVLRTGLTVPPAADASASSLVTGLPEDALTVAAAATRTVLYQTERSSSPDSAVLFAVLSLGVAGAAQAKIALPFQDSLGGTSPVLALIVTASLLSFVARH